MRIRTLKEVLRPYMDGGYDMIASATPDFLTTKNGLLGDGPGIITFLLFNRTLGKYARVVFELPVVAYEYTPHLESPR